MNMMGACKRMGLWVGVGMSATVLALPACLLVVWVAVGCMWVLGLLSLMKLVLRLMWDPRIGAMEEERKLKKDQKKMRKKEAAGKSDGRFLTQDESAEMRLYLFQQYLDDQLNTLGQQLLHMCGSDSPPDEVHLSLHVDSCDWVPNHVDEQDCLQIEEGELDHQQM